VLIASYPSSCTTSRIGQTVMYIAPFSHAAAAADYKVTYLLPPEDDDYQHRIKERR
jgi:hypothetical protein